MLHICAHCKSLAADPGQPVCDLCGQTLACQPIEEREFAPLLLIAGIRPDLFLERNTACRLFFRNFDSGPIRDPRLRLESRTAREAWEKMLPPIARGVNTDHVGVAEFLPREAGDMVLSFTLVFTDCRGARRRYEGELTMCIQDPAGGSQQAHITFNLTNSKLMGNDLSDLVRIQSAGQGDPASQSPDGFRRLPIPLHLTGFVPGQAAGPAALEAPSAGRCFARAGGRYRLAFESGDPGRRILILTRTTVALGLKKFTTAPQVDLTLRLLPCRSEELDPENWRMSRGISSPHATIQARPDGFVIRDEPGSKNGLYLAALTGGEPMPLARAASGSRLGETVPAPAPAALPETRAPVRPAPKGQWERLPEHCAIFIGQHLLELRARTFPDATGEPAALRLQRVGNAPELEYLVALRGLAIGSAPECPIRVHDPDFPPLAAVLEWRGGQWSLAATVDQPEVRLDGRVLERGRTYPIDHACRIQIGPCRWDFDAALIEDFTEL